MKKIALFFLLFIWLGTMSLSAQGWRLGLKGGINITSVSLRKKEFNTKNVTGFQVGPKLEYEGSSGFGVETAILYSQKGFGVKLSGMNDDIENDYLDIPLNLKYTFNMPIARPYILFGGYTSLRIGGDKVWLLPKEFGGRIKSSNFGSGINFEVGLDIFNHLQIGINHTIGLSDNYTVSNPEFETKGKSRIWAFTASILF